MDVINHQIETAQEEVIKAKQKYDVATEHLKELRDKKKELQTEELMEAVMKSKELCKNNFLIVRGIFLREYCSKIRCQIRY